MLLLFFSIILLLALVIYGKLNAFIALTITALFAGLANGMPPVELLKSVQNGIGGTLGGLVPVLGMGIILGSILAETGAAQVISGRLLRIFGAQKASWAVLLTGFVVGVAMFYNAGFVVLAPLVFSVAASSGRPLLPLAIAMAAPLSVTHGFLPPHPGATAVANVFGADLGKTLLLGLLVAAPAVLAAGIFFPKSLKNIAVSPPEGLFVSKEFAAAALPGFGKSLFVALLPVVLMAISTAGEFVMAAGDRRFIWLRFFGDPGVAMLLAVLLGLFFFSQNPFFKNNNLLKTSILIERSGGAVGAAASLLLIIAAGGAFKQVLVDSGIGSDLAGRLAGAPISPLLLGWGIATLLRIAVGSATVAGMTAAGIAQPLATGDTSPELMALSIGAGSLMCSHVNDTGFWMFKEWFGLSLRDTFRSWTVMETIVGTVGLAGVLALDWAFALF